jgi:hypothetical protein
MQLIVQPFGEVRLGDFLISHLADPQWATFRAAVAFVKRSGTRFIRQPLRDFSERAQVRISVGIDLYGTSREGLSDLLEATPVGQVFVYRNNGPSTFHPKVYVFKSAQQADVLVGSGNLTGGGLFTNYEASLAASLDLALPEDAAFLQIVEATLDVWSQPKQGICYLLTPDFLDQLAGSGLLRTEAELAQVQQSAAAQYIPTNAANTSESTEQDKTAGPTTALFTTFAVPQPPSIPATLPVLQVTAPDSEEEETEGVIAVAAEIISGTPAFLASVLTVDLPVIGSSNEVTITKFIRNYQPVFWGWPAQFEGPNAVTGQYRRNVRIRYGEQVFDAYLIDFPARKPDGTKASADFRLGSIAPIVADLKQEDDLLILSVSNEPNVDYIAQVVNVGAVEYEALMNGMQVYTRSRSANGTYRKFRYVG